MFLADGARAQTGPPEMPPVEVVATSPLIGSGLDRNLVPAQTNVLNRQDLEREGMPQLVRSLEREVGSVSTVSASGNPFQPTLFYRGFAASPLQGTPQGLAVYVNGMRFNQPFGDTVYWDLIPDVAIDRVNLEGSNPVFGLNALGGSLNVRLKDGFSFQGTEAAAAAGSFGHVQGEFQFGRRSGGVATYVAGSALHQNGWRDLQSSDIQNMFADIGWQSPRAELHLNVTAANSGLNGPGTAPVQLLAAAPSAQFTAPNWIANSYAAANLSGNVDLGDTLSLQALGYYRYFRQSVINGNAPNDTPCATTESGLLCFSGGPSTTVGGGSISDFLGGGQYGQLDTQSTSTHGYGGSLQLTDTGKLLGRDNNLVAGASLDIGRTQFGATSYVGGLTSGDRSFIGPSVAIDEPGTNSPVSVAADSVSWGFYLADTWRLTPRLALTASGRLNIATINLSDLAGGDLSGSHSFVHFNPAGGAGLPDRALAHGLWRLRRRQPHADPGRTLLRRPVQFLQPRQFLRRRPGPEAGGVAHLRSGPARKPSGLREGPPALQSRALPQRPRRRHRLHQQPRAGPRLLRQCRQHAPPGPRRRAAAHHRALARLCRLFLHRRHVPERLRRSLGQQPGRRSQRQHHRAAGQPAARHPGPSAEGGGLPTR